VSHIVTTVRRRSRLTTLLLTALLMVIGMAVNAPTASAAGSVSFTSWNQPGLYNVRIISDGSTFSFSGAPVGSTITTLSGSFTWTTQPSGMWYGTYLCMDLGDTQCINVGPPSYSPYSSSWSYSVDVSSLALPASTTWHVAAFISDGSTSTIHAALNPARFLTSGRVSLFYT